MWGTDDPRKRYVFFDDINNGYSIKFIRSCDNLGALRAVLRLVKLPIEITRAYVLFLEAITKRTKLIDLDDLSQVLEQHPEIAPLIRIYGINNFYPIYGKRLDIGSDLWHGINFFWDAHAKCNLLLINDVVRESLPICCICKRYYKDECKRCVKGIRPLKIDDKMAQEFHEQVLFSEVPIQSADNDNGCFLVYTFDLETFTDIHSSLHPIMCCATIQLIFFNIQSGQVKLKRTDREWAWFERSVCSMMINRNFDRVKRLGGMDNLPNSLGFVITHHPRDLELTNLPRDIVLSQNDLYEWLKEDDTVGMCDIAYRRLFGVTRVYNYTLISASYNGHKFDELLLLNHRLYAGDNVKDHEYFLKSGAVYRMNLMTKINFKDPSGEECESYNKVVRLKLFDANRYWSGSLRNVAASLKLPIRKGDMSFELINNVYNRVLEEDPFAFPEHLLFSYAPYDKVEVQEEVKKYARVIDDRLVYDVIQLLFEYCMIDVVVTEMAIDVMATNIANLCTKLEIDKINIFNKVGIPSVSKQIFLNYSKKEDKREVIYAPQGWVYELARKAIYGGRSEIQVNGIIKEPIYLIDINAMYPCCMTAPYPAGEGYVPDITLLKRFQEWLDVNVGVIGKLGAAYDTAISDIGFLIAYVDADPPERLPTYSPVPYKTSIGLAWSNEKRRNQPMTSQDMENMCRCGWRVVIKMHSPAIAWTERSFFIKDLMEFLAQLRKDAPTPDENQVIKLIGNSFYGKLMENPINNKFKFLSHRQNPESKFINDMTKFKQASDKKGDIWNSVTPIFDPYKNKEADVLETDLFLLNYSEKDLADDFNRTPSHWGAWVLSYSRSMCIHVLNHVEEDAEDPEYRPMSFFASETDSFHLSKRNYDKLPLWFFNSATMGSWSLQRKTFDFYVKVEVVGREGMYLSKKFYFILPEDTSEKPKFACKGIDKASVTYDKLFGCFSSVYFDADEGTLMYRHGKIAVEIGKMTMKRKLIGTINSSDQPSASNIESVYLARKIMPTFHLKRPREDHKSSFLLSNMPLYLKPHDDAHPVDAKHIEKGQLMDHRVYKGHIVRGDCTDEFCIGLYDE